MSRFGRKFKKMTANLLDLPHDLLFDLPRLTMIGNGQLYIENHRGVLHVSGQLVSLAIPDGRLDITGENLSIRAIKPQEVFVEGAIGSIAYKLEGEKR